MRDKSLDALLMILFGIGGMTIIVLTWSQKMQLPERILSTSIGMIGLIWTASRVRFQKSILAEIVAPRNEIWGSVAADQSREYEG